MGLTVRVSDDPIDSAVLLARFRDDQPAGSIGAIVSFTGTVRDIHCTLETLSLEHYPAMTIKALEDIAKKAIERFSLQAAMIEHRYGPMIAGDEIVFVAAAAAHREAAFDAARFMMDFLKNDAPFWKQETLKSGESEWVAAKEKDLNAQKKWRS